MMTEGCGVTSCIMMEVCGATKSTRKIISGYFYLCSNRYETVYFMMRQKLLHRIKGWVQSYQSHYDGGMWWYQLCDGGTANFIFRCPIASLNSSSPVQEA